MKIICLLRALCVGGVERQMTGLSVFLKKAGHDVSIMKYHPQNFYEEFLRENGIPVSLVISDEPDVFSRIEVVIIIPFRYHKLEILIHHSGNACLHVCTYRERNHYIDLVLPEIISHSAA